MRNDFENVMRKPEFKILIGGGFFILQEYPNIV